MRNFLAKRYTYATYIAIPATVLCILAFVFDKIGIPVLPDICIVIGLLCSLGAYICGGFVTAMKMAWKIAKFGWLVIPIFPVDVIIFIITAVYALFVLLFIPIIPVLKAKKEYAAVSAQEDILE